jgi:hypothetical protein
MDEQQQAYQQALESAGVPFNLATQCAEIVAKDDPSQPNLGRTEVAQHLIDSSVKWMKAKGFFNR